jgi:hypothetical protein
MEKPPLGCPAPMPGDAVRSGITSPNRTGNPLTAILFHFHDKAPTLLRARHFVHVLTEIEFSDSTGVAAPMSTENKAIEQAPPIRQHLSFPRPTRGAACPFVNISHGTQFG